MHREEPSEPSHPRSRRPACEDVTATPRAGRAQAANPAAGHPDCSLPGPGQDALRDHPPPHAGPCRHAASPRPRRGAGRRRSRRPSRSPHTSPGSQDRDRERHQPPVRHPAVADSASPVLCTIGVEAFPTQYQPPRPGKAHSTDRDTEPARREAHQVLTVVVIARVHCLRAPRYRASKPADPGLSGDPSASPSTKWAMILDPMG